MFSVGAFAIIFDEQGRVLLGHRRDFDMWNLPGGRVESGELPTEAVIRETKEETGLEVVIERLVGVYGKVHKDEFVFAFACRVVGGQICVTSEADQSAFRPTPALSTSKEFTMPLCLALNQFSSAKLRRQLWNYCRHYPPPRRQMGHESRKPRAWFTPSPRHPRPALLFARRHTGRGARRRQH